MALKEIEKRLKKIEAMSGPSDQKVPAFLSQCSTAELEKLYLILRETDELTEDDQAFLEDLEVRYGF
jgi:phage terminase small subunit